MRKKVISSVLALSLAVIISMFGSLSVFAASYIIDEDFALANDCKFLIPGDMDSDGEVVADDLVLLEQLLLRDDTDTSYAAMYNSAGEKAKYSDINGDEFVNIKDLVRLKKNLSKNLQFISNGVMTLNGNSAFGGEFASLLSANATYNISITYKSETPIKVKMKHLEMEFVFDSASSVKTVTKTFETPLEIKDAQSIEFQLIGVATIEKISVVRVNMDNDITDNW